jgi:transglutaminase-like putative cysteine protease
VRYVWNSSYGGIHFPKKVTTVLEVRASSFSRYWRATTLDLFAGDRWRERLDERYRSSSEVALPDPLFPHAARQTVDWTRADVHVEAFRDPHLVGGSMPVAFESGDVGSIRYLTGNVAVAERPLERGDDYSVWSYVPHPTPRQLARARGRAPALVNRYREIAPGVLAPRFGARGRDAALRRLFQRRALAPYRPLYTAAQRVVGHPRNAYAAVVALEAWFRSDGHFTYDEQPPPALFAPPLVDFVTRTRRGYCQHFAGAMALMLRYLGIPARVAAGFTTGSYDLADGVWTVTDHDAHAWVEVWFPRYGWLPFDPTPGRGPLSGSYSSASTAFDPAGAAAALGAVAGEHARDFTSQLARKYQASLVGHDRPGDLAAAPPTESHRGASLLRLLALVAAVAVAGMALVKLALRKARYLTRDPRRLAAACVRELVEFVADQGLDVPRSATISEAGTLVGRRLAVDTRAFVHAANTTRFAPPHAAEVSARQARKELRRVLRAVRRRVGIVRRVRGTVSLRSLAG